MFCFSLRVNNHSKIRRVILVGRRGVIQSAFTIKEARELIQMTSSRCLIDPREIEYSLNDSSKEEMEKSRPKKRLYDLLSKTAAEFETNKQFPRSTQLTFLKSPVECLPSPGMSR